MILARPRPGGAHDPSAPSEVSKSALTPDPLPWPSPAKKALVQSLSSAGITGPDPEAHD